MFCTACGQQLMTGAAVCPRCGHPAGVSPVPMIYNRVHRHFQALWILWLVYALWTVAQGLITLSILGGVSSGWGMQGHNPMLLWPFWGGHIPWLMPVIVVVTGLRAILSAATGLALMLRWPGARVLAIVAAVLSLVKPITGTALAIYTLWVLAPGLSRREWEQIARPGFPPVMG